MRSTRRSSIRSALLASSFLIVALAPEPALASKTFPDVVRTHWNVRKLPVSGDGCRLCHNTDAGGLTDLNRYFGYRMQKIYGVRRAVSITLQRALDQVKTRGDDSDQDTVSDYDEIVVDSTNPNDKNSHRVFVVPSEGGAGGADSEGNGSDAPGGGGGEAPAGEEPPPPLEPEPIPELPPPVWHGCSFGVRAASGLPALGMLALVGGLAAWRRRRTARPVGRSEA